MVTYDITSDRIRARVRKTLYDHGTRVQYSVFECELTRSQQETLQQTLAGQIETDDSIRWYPLCKWCTERIVIQGQGIKTEFPDFFLL